MLSVKVLGCAVPEKAARSNDRGQTISPVRNKSGTGRLAGVCLGSEDPRKCNCLVLEKAASSNTSSQTTIGTF